MIFQQEGDGQSQRLTVISTVLNLFALRLLHYSLEKLLQFALKDYYILR